MKTKPLLPLCLFLCCHSIFGQAQTSEDIHTLSKQHQFILMDSLNEQVHGKDYFFYKALFANVCNQPALSNQYLSSLKSRLILNSYDVIKLRNDNDIKTFNYAQAYSSSKILTSRYKEQFSKEELQEELNAQRIWQLLKTMPAQEMDRFSTICIASKKDKADLITIPVNAAGTMSDFVFDTGAGISCITKSLAKKMGMRILPDNGVYVKSFTGQSNKVRVAIAPEIRIGDLKIRHAVFLVYPDQAFSFANGAYVINGIIGFPIAKELGSITIEENQLTFSKTNYSAAREKNFFVDQLRAIVMLRYRGKTFPYNFDSGAKTSEFSRSFYLAYQTYIDAEGRAETSKTASAGGLEVANEMMVLNNQEIFLGSSLIKLPKMTVNCKQYGVYGPVNYGNIGQDVIRQFHKVTLSFDQNYLKLEP